MNELNTIAKLSEKYSNKPIVRALCHLIPGWSSADTLLQQRANEIKRERIIAFFDAIASGETELTNEIIETEDFLHCYYATLHAAINSRRKEKIKVLAKLLASSHKIVSEDSIDGYEEILSALENISYREFAVLQTLYNYEIKHPFEGNENVLQNTMKYWDTFKTEIIKKYNIPENQFLSFIKKTERTGLYLQITGAYWGYKGDKGRTTSLWQKLVDYIKENKN